MTSPLSWRESCSDPIRHRHGEANIRTNTGTAIKTTQPGAVALSGMAATTARIRTAAPRASRPARDAR